MIGERRAAPGGVGLLLATLMLGTVAAAPVSRPGDVARRVLREARYQTQSPDSLRPTGGKSRQLVFKLPEALSVVLKWLLWGIIAAAVALLVVAVGREVWNHSTRARLGPASEAIASETHSAEERLHLPELEILVREGRYAEAVHVLLLRALDLVLRREPQSLAPALTSREILSRVHLPQPARHALGDLVAAVEASHFGGRPPSREDFATCLESFGRITSAAPGGVG